MPAQQQLPPQQTLYGGQPQQAQPQQAQPQATYQPRATYQTSYQPQQPPAYEPPAYEPAAYQQPAYQQPAFQPAPPPPPSMCSRCYASIPAGYTQCPNCGLEVRGAWGAQAPAHRSYAMPAAIAVIGLCLIVVAGSIFVVAQGGSKPAATPTGMVVVGAATESPALLLTPSPDALASDGASASAAPGKSAAAPSGVWTTFNSPDGKWSESFPGKTAPLKSTTDSGSGDTAIAQTTYTVEDASGATYLVDTADLSPAVVSSLTTDEILQVMEGAFVSSEFALVASSDTTESGYTAKDLTLASGNATVDIRMWMVDDRFYLLETVGSNAAPAYPQYFFKSFQLK
jgi:hypothetical protein